MNNIKGWIAIFFVIGLSLLPPIDFYIKNFSNDYWTWAICVAGFLGCLTVFLDTNIFVKIISVGGFLNCFLSIAPYISFTSYISLVGCCYLYIFCCGIKNWVLVFKMIKAVAIFSLILFVMQFFHHDQLLNFGGTNDQFGGVGQHMRMGSFGAILTSLLIVVNPWLCLFGIAVGLFCKSTWTLIAVSCGTFFINKKLFIVLLIIGVCFIIYLGKIKENISGVGRMPVWKKTVELSNKKPIWGYGIGTYKLVFAPLARLHDTAWKTAHNDWFEILFEAGRPGLLFIITMFSWLFFLLWYKQDWICLAGLTMIMVDMVSHFPMRMMNTVPLIILFLAFCEQRIRYGCNSIKDNAC
jgi:hypothetical protein